MRLLFDQNVPRNLIRHLTGHTVARSARFGWHELENGDLLDAAESRGFDVLVTADKNMQYQQKMEVAKSPLFRFLRTIGPPWKSIRVPLFRQWTAQNLETFAG